MQFKQSDSYAKAHQLPPAPDSYETRINIIIICFLSAAFADTSDSCIKTQVGFITEILTAAGCDLGLGFLHRLPN